MNLVIQACEGGFYIAKLTDEAHSERWLRALCHRHGLTYKANMRFHSLAHIREYFAALIPVNVWLEHNTAYDEMIGLPSGEGSYRQPLYWYQENHPIAKSA
ncbi:DUF6482 family protein [Marinagarivorans algicola]|uniref:DUF6482 family protein n=1 Tax=Marinagarivorans algicola TaxID=1513270 RepID=UPI0006B554E0|nr:DUF6482 family protein [Marinagarivorans algicola]